MDDVALSVEERAILAHACENQQGLRQSWGAAPAEELERYQHAMVSLLRHGYVNLYSVRLWNPMGNEDDERLLDLDDAIAAALNREWWVNPYPTDEFPNPDPLGTPEIEVYGTRAGWEALQALRGEAGN